jgi:hypothetical protein
MTKQVQLRRGTTSEHAVFTGAEGELTIDTTLDIAIVHDGVTVGGRPLVGAAATQQILNKTGVGIGTSSITKEFEVVGDVDIEGQITSRGLTVRYQDPIIRSGIISATPNNKIIGISTNNIRVGHSVTATYISTGSTVISIGFATVFLSQNTESSSGVSTGKFLTSGGTRIVGVTTFGIASVGYAVSAPGVLSNTTVTSVSGDYFGSVTLSQNSSGTLGITTLSGNSGSIGTTIITGITTTNLQLGDQVENDFIGSGIGTITQIGSNTITIGNAISTSGSLSFTLSRLVTVVFSDTNIAISSITFQDPYMGQINADVVNANNVAISTLTVSEPVGIITITTSDITTAGIASAIITDSYVTNQVVTTQNVTTNNIDTANITTGIITSAGITTSTIDNLYVNVGIGTTLGISSARIDNLYYTSGISTFTKNTGVGTFGNVVIGSYVGVGTTSLTGTLGISTLYPAGAEISGITTTGLSVGQLVSGPYIQYPSLITSIGISSITLSLVSTNVGIATTTTFEISTLDGIDLNVTGNAVISGILTVGVSTLAVNGNDSSIVGVSTIRSEYVGSNVLRVYEKIVANSPTITSYQGTLSAASTTIISSISTSFINPGFAVTGIYIPTNSTVVSIGTSEITISTPTTNIIPVQVTNGSVLTANGSVLVGVNTVDIFVGSAVTGTYVSGGSTVTDIHFSSVTLSTNTTAPVGISTYTGTLSSTGISTITGISTSDIQIGEIVSGLNILPSTTVTAIGSSEITLSQPASNVGVSTQSFTFKIQNIYTFTYPDGAIVTDTYYFSNESQYTSTLPNIEGNNLTYTGTGSITNIISDTLETISFDASNINISGIGTINQLKSSSGIVTTISGVNLNYSGLSTIGNVTIGSGSTEFIVDGDARITGVLTIGQSSITVDGLNSTISGINTLYSVSGVVTNISGTNINFSGISTLNQVGLSTLTFVGINSATSLDKSIQFKLSNVGIATNYTLTLPPNRGRDGMSLTVDAFGNLGFSTNPGGLYENRIYVSSANGNDNDDGKTKPVASIKRAAQLASFESFVLPENRYLDAANILDSNKSFIQTEVVGFITATYPGITTNPDWDRSICSRDVGYIVDAIVYDLTYNGNSKSVGAGLSYYSGVGIGTTTYVDGEKIETIAGFQYIYQMSKFIINNVAITTSNLGIKQVGVQTVFQTFDNTLLYDEQCNPVGYSTACCANVQSTIVNLVGIVTSIIGIGTTAAPEITLPTSKSNPVAIIVEAGEYLEDNPIILYEDVALLGDNLRNTIIRPSNAGKDLLRVRNGCYLTGFAMKDYVDNAGVPQYTFDYAVAFDDPTDTTTSRVGYAIKTNKPIITRSPYIQNCSLLSFLGANGMKVDGSKVDTINTAIIPEESENPVEGDQPSFGKSMVAAAFTMVSFGGVGWRVFNDGYSQVVSCFQIFCKYGSIAQSGGYLSITNSATNFGRYALRSTGFSKNSFAFDRGRISATGTSGGLATLKVVGLGRSDQDLYVLRFFDDTLTDRTINFKPLTITEEINGATDVDIANNQITSIGHGFVNNDSVVYFGDDGSIPPRIIGGLVPDNQYWIGYIDANTFRLYEDDGLANIVDLTATSTGIHTFQKNGQEFFAKEVIEAHNVYQRIGIASTSSTLKFVSGRTISQTVVGGIAVGIAYTYNSSTRELIVSIEESAGTRRNFQITNGTTNLTISDHNSSPISIAVTSVAGLSTYWTNNFKVDSTDSGTPITGIATLPENYRLHFHRPSIVNSSSHTWEYSGSGTDYNALPQNGGKTDTRTEQVSELGGRVFSSGTNELGDFKIGDFITAYNRTGNIIFNNTVTIGTLDSIRLSLSGGTPITAFSADIGLGDNELGGPLDSRVSTQLAVRSFLNNRLGSFIDKNVSTNAVPGAIVQLNSIGQINSDLIPPKVTNYYRASVDGGRTQLVNYIPTTDLSSGDTVVEPTNAYVLINDVLGQYLVLNNSTVYNFLNGDIVYGTVSQGGAVGIVTTPTSSGVNTSVLSFPNVGYGTTGLVRGVPLSLKDLNGGSGYASAGIYTGVRLDTASGIGTGITATITVSAGGTVSQVAINTGGYKFVVDDLLTLNDPTPVGGRSGGANFTVKVSSVETRLYLKLTNNQKFQGSVTLPDYIQDRNAVAISTNVGIATTSTFTPTDIGVGGSIDFINDRIEIGTNTFGNGDPVIYSNNGGTNLDELTNNGTYYVKRVGISSIELYTTYALSSKVNFTASGTGTHKLTRIGINTSTDQITFVNHGYSIGDPVRVAIGSTGTSLPTGIATDSFYFVGSATTNSFTLHSTRTDALLSVNGLLYNTIDITSIGSGIVSFTKQNVTYSSSVNTSSNDISNWALLASNDIDAANIISGTVSPSRLANGTANTQTFLRGDSNWSKVVTSVGIGTTQPIGVTYTSADLAPGGVGINTYYGNVNITLNRVESTLDAYSTLGVSKFKNSTFSISADGAIQIKNAAGGGDVDAATLSGNNGAYYLDVTNHNGTIPISRGGTGLSALPSAGAFLIGNGSAYQLTTTPTFTGDATFNGGAGAITISANSDITFTTSPTWSGNVNGKIQYYNNSLYLTFATSLILRSTASDIFSVDSSGSLTASSTIQGTRLISTISTGAPLTVTSTTRVDNLNVQYLSGLPLNTDGRADNANEIVRTDGSGYIQAGLINTTSGDLGVGSLLDRVYCSNDGYIRYLGLTDFKQQIGLSAKNSYHRRQNTTDSNYWVGSMGWSNTVAAGANEVFHGGSGFFDIWSGTNFPSTFTHIHGINMLHYTTNSLGSTGGSAYGWQLATQYDSDAGPFWRRNNAGTFSAWRKIWHDSNDGSGSGLDADLLDGYNASTSNSASTVAVRDSAGGITNTYYNSAYNGSNSGLTRSSYAYAFGFQEAGAWSGTYPDLVLQYHTGVTLAANPSYEGIRFKNDYNDDTLRFQINGTSGYTYKYSWMKTDTTGFYTDTNGAHLYPNAGSSYTQWRLDGNRNGYGGIWDSYSAVNIGMYDSAGNGGVYREANGRWYFYHLVSNNCMGVNTSTTSASYGLYVSKGIYSTGTITAASDARKKTDIKTVTNALEKVNQLRGVTYKRIDYEKDDVRNGTTELGVIAQEVELIVPEVVTYADDVDEYAVSYGNFAGLFIEAIKEQTTIINSLKKEIEELRSKLGE